MIDSELLEYEHELGLKILMAFQTLDPDESFIERLQRELANRINASRSSTVDQNSLNWRFQWRGKIKLLFPPLAWGAIVLILVLILTWGIKTLIPRTLPGAGIQSTPSPSLSPSPLPPTLSAPSLDNAVFYTVEAGDTLASIANNTNVPTETLQNLNAFVLQLNELAPGLQLVIGFEGQAPVFYTVKEGDTILGISDKAGISVENFVTLNRIGYYPPNMQTPLPVPDYILKPGMQVIVGLHNITTNENGGD